MGGGRREVPQGRDQAAIGEGRPIAAALAALALLIVVTAARAAAESSIQLDPFAQATNGSGHCKPRAPRLYAPEEARVEAHVRVERGTRCALDGSCEPGGAYKRDPEINARVRDAIAGERRFARTSVWVTTSRRWVTIEGCVASNAQRRELVAFVHAQPGVERVFDELEIAR